ncbi:hypothetical protein B0H17DRAFT_1072127 [Mycena rosella]|uniref:Uncharacterized protein n=1 Tax=Mycena rosella TaxID=1033263 RepID=A0AAD7GDX7_MYCRO|nr:hypothetical protein B0H17DRAFT_1072127 [Mycena rosella]
MTDLTQADWLGCWGNCCPGLPNLDSPYSSSPCHSARAGPAHGPLRNGWVRPPVHI